MIDVEEVYQSCKQLLSKDKGGYITSDEFNARSKRAEIMLWNYYIKHFEEHGHIPDGVYPFNANSQVVMDSNGQFPVPDDFARRTVCWYVKTTTVLGGEPTIEDIPVDYLEREEVQETRRSALRGPSASNDRLYFTFSNGKAQVYPVGLSGYIKFEYLRLPVYGSRGYNLNLSTLEEEPDSGSAINYEWPEKERSNLEDMILLQYGVMLKETPILNWAASQMADARNIQKQ